MPTLALSKAEEDDEDEEGEALDIVRSVATEVVRSVEAQTTSASKSRNKDDAELVAGKQAQATSPKGAAKSENQDDAELMVIKQASTSSVSSRFGPSPGEIARERRMSKEVGMTPSFLSLSSPSAAWSAKKEAETPKSNGGSDEGSPANTFEAFVQEQLSRLQSLLVDEHRRWLRPEAANNLVRPVEPKPPLPLDQDVAAPAAPPPIAPNLPNTRVSIKLPGQSGQAKVGGSLDILRENMPSAQVKDQERSLDAVIAGGTSVNLPSTPTRRTTLSFQDSIAKQNQSEISEVDSESAEARPHEDANSRGEGKARHSVQSTRQSLHIPVAGFQESRRQPPKRASTAEAFKSPRISVSVVKMDQNDDGSSFVPSSSPRVSVVTEEEEASGRASVRRQDTAPARLSVAMSDRSSRRQSRQMDEIGSKRLSALSLMSSSERWYEIHPLWAAGSDYGSQARRTTKESKSAADMDELLELRNSEAELQAFKFLDRLIAQPSAITCMLWDLFGLILIFYDCVTIPLQAAFSPPQTPWTGVLEWFARLYWTCNIFASFFRGYVKTDGSTEMKFAKVSKNYIVTWLPFDFFVVIFDWIEVVAMDAGPAAGVRRYAVTLRTARLVRTVRLVRLLKAPEITKKITEFIPFSEQLALLGEIGKIMTLFLWVAHLFACLWYLLGELGRDDENSNSWLDAFYMNDQSIEQKYIRSLHWSMGVFSGESNVISPQNPGERTFVTLTLFMGYVVGAWYVGSITTSMTRLQIMASEQSTKLAALRRFLLENSISRGLAVRVQRNAQFAMQEQKSKAPEKNIELLRVISTPVLMELHYEIHSKVLNLHPFFLNYHDINSAGIRKVCHLALDMVSLHPGDVLFSHLEVPSVPRMFFVVEGSFQYIQKDFVCTVGVDEWMSEAVLWTRWTHCGSAKAMKKTRIMALSAEDFQDIISTFPSNHAPLYAMEFVECLNNTEEKLSDTCASKEDVAAMVERAFPEEADSSSDEDEDTQAAPTGWFPGQVQGKKRNSQDRVGKRRTESRRSSENDRQSVNALLGRVSKLFGSTGDDVSRSMRNSRSSRSPRSSLN